MRVRFGLIVLLLGVSVACSDSPSSPSPSPGQGGGSAVSIVNGAETLTTTAYAPNPVTVAVGGSVTWTNNDSTAHTSTSNTGAFDSGVIPPGGRFSMTFNTAGSFPYHCTLHPGMIGTVTVQ